MASLYNWQWNGTHFIGHGLTANDDYAVWQGSSAVDIPETTLSFPNSDTAPFKPAALSSTDQVVGYWTTNQDQVAAVWSPGGNLQTLTSLSAKTSIDLERAEAVDRRGDIFGIGLKGDDEYLFEAVVKGPPPKVTIKTSKPGKHYKKGSTLKASYSCKAGALETLKSCKGTVKNHHKISTAKVGKHSFKVVATDLDGQKTTTTVHYKVKK